MDNQRRKVLLGQMAGRQFGRVTWAQIRGLGVDRATITQWVYQGYLHPQLPRVYAVGHPGRSIESDLAAALLYAGPGAMLSHTTAAWWVGLLDDQPGLIHVTTPRDVPAQPGLRVHSRRQTTRVWRRGLPITAVPQTFLDLAAQSPLRTVRRALAKADYAGILNVPAVQAATGVGRPGSARLRAALGDHLPYLARTKSHLEVRFLEICESAGLPMPETNVYVAGWEVDALFREQRIAVEIDGPGNHRSPAQVRRDRKKELALRQRGLTPIRYSDEQLEHPKDVVAELAKLL
jgi:hypothetical protein